MWQGVHNIQTQRQSNVDSHAEERGTPAPCVARKSHLQEYTSECVTEKNGWEIVRLDKSSICMLTSPPILGMSLQKFQFIDKEPLCRRGMGECNKNTLPRNISISIIQGWHRYYKLNVLYVKWCIKVHNRVLQNTSSWWWDSPLSLNDSSVLDM